MGAGEGKKNREMLGLPTLRGPTLRGPPPPFEGHPKCPLSPLPLPIIFIKIILKIEIIIIIIITIRILIIIYFGFKKIGLSDKLLTPLTLQNSAFEKLAKVTLV